MPEYIERETLLEDLKLLAKYQQGERQQGILGVCVTIKNRPTADVVKVKHGVWRLETDEEMSNPMFKLVVCSVCNEKANHTYKFCPNCGAKMDGANERP